MHLSYLYNFICTVLGAYAWIKTSPQGEYPRIKEVVVGHMIDDRSFCVNLVASKEFGFISSHVHVFLY